MGCFHLSPPALVSSLGEGVQSHVDALFGEWRHYYSPSDVWVGGKTLQYGAFTGELRPFPATVPAHHRSRNNHLLWHAMAQLEPLITQLKSTCCLSRIGVVLGTSTSGGDENLGAFQRIQQGVEWCDSGFSQEKQLLSSPANFVRDVYGLTGPAYAISTACTSGARALISAARLLHLGLCDAVICGGVDTLSKLTCEGFYALEVLSESHCRPFAEGRDGINIGEAAAVFVMTRERMPTAHEQIGLLGWGASSDAYHMSSPRPDATGAIQAMRDALHKARIDADEIAWLNLHGTGTAQNDAMEALAVSAVFGASMPCASTKGLTGHTLGAAGALEAAFLYLVCSRQLNTEGRLPAHHLEGNYDPSIAKIHLSEGGDIMPAQRRRLGMSTSYAFGGNNTALILGEYE